MSPQLFPYSHLSPKISKPLNPHVEPRYTLGDVMREIHRVNHRLETIEGRIRGQSSTPPHHRRRSHQAVEERKRVTIAPGRDTEADSSAEVGVVPRAAFVSAAKESPTEPTLVMLADPAEEKNIRIGDAEPKRDDEPIWDAEPKWVGEPIWDTEVNEDADDSINLPGPTEAVEPMISLLDENLQRGPITEQAVGPVIQILGPGVHVLQQRAIKALADPPLPHALWESATFVLSSSLQYSSEYFLGVPVDVLVQLLRSGTEGTVIGALNALLVLESVDSTNAEAMVESGAVEALLELLKYHQCEETAARLLKTLINNGKIRESKAAKSQQGRLLAALALGDPLQNEGLARATHKELSPLQIDMVIGDTWEESSPTPLRLPTDYSRNSYWRSRTSAKYSHRDYIKEHAQGVIVLLPWKEDKESSLVLIFQSQPTVPAIFSLTNGAPALVGVPCDEVDASPTPGV